MEGNQTNLKDGNERLIFRTVFGISIFVFITVVLLNRKLIPAPKELPSWTYLLPKLNFIRRKRIQIHKGLNITTFILSSIFLISYILFHWMAGDTHYPVDAPARGLYFFILITHILCAALVLPLILLSFYRGLKMQVMQHKKLVRFAFPIWLYVTITGVVVYLMISPYYPQ